MFHSSHWLTEDETLQRLQVGSSALRERMRKGGYFLGVRLRHRPGPEGKRVYSASDVNRIAGATRPYAAFRDAGGNEWLPLPDVAVRFPLLTSRLDHWMRRGCPLLPHNRRPCRERFPTHGTGATGISRRWFYLADDLSRISAALHAGQSAPDNGAVSHAQARELGFTSFAFWEQAKRRGKKVRRPVERNGIKRCVRQQWSLWRSCRRPGRRRTMARSSRSVRRPD
jgi:hypothetical protein